MRWGALFKFDIFRTLLILLDGASVALGIWLAYALVFDGSVPAHFAIQQPYFLAMFLLGMWAMFSFLGVYSRRNPQLSERDARWIVLGATIAEGLNFVVQNGLSTDLWLYWVAFWGFAFIARSLIGIYASYRTYFFPSWQLYAVPLLVAVLGVALLRLQPITIQIPLQSLPISRVIHVVSFSVALGGILLSRWVLHWVFLWYKTPHHGRVARAILVGSDLELALFAQLNEISRRYKVVAILDNDPLKKGLRMQEARVVGRIDQLPEVARQFSSDHVLLLKESLAASEIQHVEDLCRKSALKLVRLGSLQESLIRSDSLSTSDLLERCEYRFLPSEQENYLKAKRVMVTGAGGSIGSELVRQILRCEPAQVILLGRGENSIFELEQELRGASLLHKTRSVIVNITDRKGLQRAFVELRPQVVFHAAAHKHVPLMEQNIHEAVRNNVLGTWNVMELAGQQQVERVVMISTDKAVAPKSVMGATKRKAESVVAHCAKQYPQTLYSVVRFGNVLGSRGSVVRLFLDQIRRGGPVTVTDPRMTRYFMTIPEAVSLVLATGLLSRKFGIFVLEMGLPHRIVDLAEKMIRLCGLEPGLDIQIQFTGVRPGEKLDEVLVQEGEELVETANPQVRRLASPQAAAESVWLPVDEDFEAEKSEIRQKLLDL